MLNVVFDFTAHVLFRTEIYLYLEHRIQKRVWYYFIPQSHPSRSVSMSSSPIRSTSRVPKPRRQDYYQISLPKQSHSETTYQSEALLQPILWYGLWAGTQYICHPWFLAPLLYVHMNTFLHLSRPCIPSCRSYCVRTV